MKGKINEPHWQIKQSERKWMTENLKILHNKKINNMTDQINWNQGLENLRITTKSYK